MLPAFVKHHHVVYPGRTVCRTYPEGLKHPGELRHPGSMMQCHIIRNPRYETPDIRKPMLSHRVYQRAPLLGAGHDRSRTTITNCQLTRQIPNSIDYTWLNDNPKFRQNRLTKQHGHPRNKYVLVSIPASISQTEARQSIREGENLTHRSMLVNLQTKSVTPSSQRYHTAR